MATTSEADESLASISKELLPGARGTTAQAKTQQLSARNQLNNIAKQFADSMADIDTELAADWINFDDTATDQAMLNSTLKVLPMIKDVA